MGDGLAQDMGGLPPLTLYRFWLVYGGNFVPPTRLSGGGVGYIQNGAHELSDICAQVGPRANHTPRLRANARGFP